MGRKRTVNKGLPKGLHLKEGRYYHVTSGTPRKWTALGPHRAEALLAWARLEGTEPAPDARTFEVLAARYSREVIPTKAPRTQRDNVGELERLQALPGTSSMASPPPACAPLWPAPGHHATGSAWLQAPPDPSSMASLLPACTPLWPAPGQCLAPGRRVAGSAWLQALPGTSSMASPPPAGPAQCLAPGRRVAGSAWLQALPGTSSMASPPPARAPLWPAPGKGPTPGRHAAGSACCRHRTTPARRAVIRTVRRWGRRVWGIAPGKPRRGGSCIRIWLRLRAHADRSRAERSGDS